MSTQENRDLSRPESRHPTETHDEAPSPAESQDLEKGVEKMRTHTTHDSNEAPQFIDVPDGGLHAWMSVAALFLVNCATWASNSAYSIYLAHYLQYDTFAGATKLDYATIGGLSFGAGLIMGPLIRLLINRTSVRITMSVGATTQFVGIMLAAFSTKLWQIYLTQGLVIGFGLALIAMPAMTIVPQWFRKKRQMAMAIAAAGSGTGGIVFNLAIQAIIKLHGLRWALIIQAIMCAFCTGMALCLVRLRSEEIKIVPKVWETKMLTYKVFWFYAIYVTMTMLGYVVLMYNLADFTISLGYSAHQGSIVSCMISVGIVVGRPTVGSLSDRFGAVTTSIFVHIIVGVLCLAMWIPARNLATAIAFALIQGGLMGSVWVVLAGIGARIVGLRKMDIVLCMVWIFIGAFGIISPIIGIKLRASVPEGVTTDPTVYTHPSIWCGCMYLGSALMLWFMRAYLIARDTEAEKGESHEDNDELHIEVSWVLLMKNLFLPSKTRLV